MVVTSLRSQNRNVLQFMTEEPFAPLGGVVILPFCYPRRVLPQNQCHWLLAPPLNGYIRYIICYHLDTVILLSVLYR